MPLSDSFTYSDGALDTQSSGVWDTPSGLSPTVSSNALTVGTTSTACWSVHQTSLGSTDHYAEADVTIGSNYSEGGVIVRSDNSASTYYRATWSNGSTDKYSIYKRVSGTYTLVSETTTTGTGTRKIRLEVDGDQLTMSVDGSIVVGPVTDTSITTGNYAGVELYKTVASGPIVDDFAADTLGVTVVEGTASGTISMSGAGTATVTEAVFEGTASGTISMSGAATGTVGFTPTIYAGATLVDAIYIGADAVDAIYAGSTRVF